LNQDKLNLKVVASKAFIAGGSLVLASMVLTTIYTLFTQNLEGVDYFAAPLIGFYVAIPLFIVLFPVLFLVILTIDWLNQRKKRSELHE
tara:strand:+ start:73 stop:339 length:267 start_codon:yes stop_codon:yes gene_type:complete